MASVTLVKLGKPDVVVETATDFVNLIYGKGYLPQTGTVAEAWIAFETGTALPPFNPNHRVTVGDLADPSTEANASVRVTAVEAVEAAPVVQPGGQWNFASSPTVDGEPIVGEAGVIDHGALEGLADDDHPQYLTQTRGDARYYTQDQTDTALADKQPAGSYATPADVASASTTDRDRANHTGTQLSGTIADLTEAVQDIVAAFVAPGTGMTKSYDDVGNLLTLNFTGGTGGTTDPEIVRDVIGGALVQGAGINIVVNDDTETTGTITISSTAVLPSRQVVAGTGLSGGGDLSANRTLSVNYGSTAGTAIQGSEKGAANGVATLDGSSKIPSAQLPDIAVSDYLGTVASQAAMLALTGQRGDWAIRSDLGTTWVLTTEPSTALGSWTQLSYPTAPVTSVASKTGAVTLAKADVGLGNVDNTSDANKPVSTAQATALSGKASTTHAATHATGGTDPVTPAAIGAAAAVHTHQAAEIANSTAVGQAVVTAVDQAAARAAIGVTSTGGVSLDRPGGYQTDGSRRASFAFGYAGEGNLTGADTGHQRLPIKLPVKTSRWRLRISNRHPNGTAGTGSANYGPFYLGKTVRSSTGDPTAVMTSPVQVLAASGTQAPNTEWVSGWVTNSAHQITDIGDLYTLSMGWSKTAGTTLYFGSGGGFWNIYPSDAGLATPVQASSYTEGVFFSVTLEYEFLGNQKVLVALGDSITEGRNSRFNFMSWHQRLSMRLGMPVCMASQFGSFASAGFANNWSGESLTHPRWQRLRDADCNIDAAIVYLGTNDCVWGATLAQFQTAIPIIISRIKSEWGARDVFGVTLPPRSAGAGTAPETLRNQINDWLKSGQPAFTDVFNPDVLMENAIGSDVLPARYLGTGSDTTHFNPAGHSRFADAIEIGT